MKRFSGSACIELEGFQTAIDELLISDEKYQQFDGIIGLNVLKNLNIVIDLENKELLPKDKSKFKHVFHCQVKNTELSEMERNFKIHLKEELPDLNPKSDFDCGNGIDVAPEQMMINVKPLGIKYYSAPISKDIQANIDEMLKYNIISRSQVVEVSPFYTIIKFDKESNAPKKFYDENGNEFTRMRVLLDTREVNNKTVKISYQPNTAFRIIQHLREFSYASVLDLHQAFSQVKLHPNNYNMFSFTYNRQTYSYNRLPQGAVNSPIIFQRTMELVLE
uniref:Reverse transcriptase domain-containing protein n=1 Tax=Strongyloides papillosus TaxID=174720 RepID=A0A0N5BDJ8_STREA